VTDCRWVIQEGGGTACDGKKQGQVGVGQNRQSQTDPGSVTIDTGRMRTPDNTAPSHGQVSVGYGGWDLNTILTRVMDSGVFRSMFVASRGHSYRSSRMIEMGVLSAVSLDGRSAILSIGKNYQPVVVSSDIALECGVNNTRQGPVCHRNQRSARVQTSSGLITLNGYQQFMFYNGDAVINDSMNGVYWALTQEMR
jgi:hypothetical protein